MGYWHKGEFVKSSNESRKQISEVRSVVDQVVANVECGAITARDALRELLNDYPALKKEHRNHPLISSRLIELYSEFWIPKIVARPLEKVQHVTNPALLRDLPVQNALEAGQSEQLSPI